MISETVAKYITARCMPQQRASNSLPTHTSHNRNDYSQCGSRTIKAAVLLQHSAGSTKGSSTGLTFLSALINCVPSSASLTLFTHTRKHLDPVGLRKSSWRLLAIFQRSVIISRGEEETPDVVGDLMDLGLRLTFVTLACVLECAQRWGLTTERKEDWASGELLSLHFWVWVWKSRLSEELAPGQQIHKHTLKLEMQN